MKTLSVLIYLALMTSIQGNVFDANGMSSISDIIRYISDIESASTDLDVMEHRLKNLDTKTGTVSNLKTSLTSAMDKAALTFNGEHTNVEGEQGGKLSVNTFPCIVDFI